MEGWEKKSLYKIKAPVSLQTEFSHIPVVLQIPQPGNRFQSSWDSCEQDLSQSDIKQAVPEEGKGFILVSVVQTQNSTKKLLFLLIP